MIKVLRNTSPICLRADNKNKMYAEGYRYYVYGNYRVQSTIDPWSGMPNVEGDITFFSDKAEAEAYAKTQIWVFNSNVTAEVETLKEHEETWAERRERERKEAEEAKAKKLAKEMAKAEAQGMTLEEYKKAQALKKKKARLAREIAELEAEIAEKNAELARL